MKLLRYGPAGAEKPGLLDDDGAMATAQKNMTDQVSDITKQIADHERVVQSNRDKLIRSFVAMEQ